MKTTKPNSKVKSGHTNTLAYNHTHAFICRTCFSHEHPRLIKRTKNNNYNDNDDNVQ